MKKIMVFLIIISIFLTACTMQEPAETVPEETIEEPQELVEEVEEEVEEEIEEEVEEAEEVEEEVEEAEMPSLKEQLGVDESAELLRVGEGDTVTAFGKEIYIEQIDNYGSLVAFEVDGTRSKLMRTGLTEIVEDYVFEIAQTTFNEDSMVTLSMKPLELAENEYFLKRGESVTVDGKKITLGDVKSPTHGKPSAYVSVEDVVVDLWIREGETEPANGFDITLNEAFYLHRDAARIKVVPT